MNNLFSICREDDKNGGRIIWTQDQIDYIIYSYNEEHSIPTIAKKFNTNTNSIRKVLRQNGIKILSISELQQLKFPRNSFYFDNINTAAKAYWLGFLMADGYISKDTAIRLNLKRTDENHLKKFLKAIEANNHTIKYSQKIDGLKTYEQAYCSIKDKRMVEDLAKLGCVNNKSYTLRFPEIDEKFFSHFIRGYFDGDGSLHWTQSGKNKRPNWRVTFVGTKPFLEKIREILKKEKLSIENRGSYCMFSINGNRQLKQILEYIYKDSFEEIELDRKRQIYNQYLLQSFGGEPENSGCE